jgi:hypothetical protein
MDLWMDGWMEHGLMNDALVVVMMMLSFSFLS